MESKIVSVSLIIIKKVLWCTQKEMDSLKTFFSIPLIYGKQAESRGWIEEWNIQERKKKK